MPSQWSPPKPYMEVRYSVNDSYVTVLGNPQDPFMFRGYWNSAAIQHLHVHISFLACKDVWQLMVLFWVLVLFLKVLVKRRSNDVGLNYIQYLLQPNAKNSMRDLKEMTRMKLCNFAYFTQGLGDDLFTKLIQHWTANVCPVYLETCYILHHSNKMFTWSQLCLW